MENNRISWKILENQTHLPQIHIADFFISSAYNSLYFNMFLLLYLTGLLSNSVIITIIYIDKHLHTPMYLFLCNLSLIDFCYTTVTIPKLLHMLRSGDYTVSFIECFTQVYFFDAFAFTEVVLLSIMAFDRYVAICNPLHYQRILSRKHCMQLMAAVWLIGFLNSLVITLSAANMSFSHSYIIHQFFCDTNSLMIIASTHKEVYFIVIYVELFVFGVGLFFSTLMSYIIIISTIIQIKSRDGRQKAFSTCSSHLMVLIIFYGTGTSVIVIPPSDHYRVIEMIFTVQYTAVTPILNPLIYSLQNKAVKRAIKRCAGIR